ncbi:MAG: cupin domain-containing protein [Pseudomonadota bacterium]|nr:cupin domain-containing protein [Pseudomonadota bacterium]
MRMTVTIFVLGLALFTTAQAQQQQSTNVALNDTATIHTADRITWRDGPPSLPPGAKFAVLEGDPAKDGFFTMRLRLPDGFKIPPHTHPKVEHITVVSGTFNFGMGDKFDESATQAMPAGTFGFWPAGMKHFAWTKGETVLQLHGTGPWKIEYVNPADDPRKPK